MTDVISEIVLGSFWLMLPGQRPTTRPSISLKFALETRLESESFEPFELKTAVFFVKIAETRRLKKC